MSEIPNVVYPITITAYALFIMIFVVMTIVIPRVPKKYRSNMTDLYDFLEDEIENTQDKQKLEELVVLREGFAQFLRSAGYRFEEEQSTTNQASA